MLNKEARFIHCLVELVFIHRLIGVFSPTDVVQLNTVFTRVNHVFVFAGFFSFFQFGSLFRSFFQYFWQELFCRCIRIFGFHFFHGRRHCFVFNCSAVRIVFRIGIGIAQNCAFFHDRVCRDRFGVFFGVAFFVNLVFRIPFAVVCFDHVYFCTINFCFCRGIVDRRIDRYGQSAHAVFIVTVHIDVAHTYKINLMGILYAVCIVVTRGGNHPAHFLRISNGQGIAVFRAFQISQACSCFFIRVRVFFGLGCRSSFFSIFFRRTVFYIVLGVVFIPDFD